MAPPSSSGRPRKPARGGQARRGKGEALAGRDQAGARKFNGDKTGKAGRRNSTTRAGERGAQPRGRRIDRRERPTRKDWGGVARHGVRVLDETGAGTASSAWRQAVMRSRRQPPHPPPDRRPDQESWIVHEDGDGVAGPAERGQSNTPGRSPRRHRVPKPVVKELTAATDQWKGARLAERLGEASHAYDRDRYQDALRILRPLAEAAPQSAAVRELYGLTLYRLGRWRAAMKELEASRSLSPSYDQVPVVMDCLRALGRHRDVAAAWDELRRASPSPEVVAEGRIVMASALADQGELRRAIAMLEKNRTIHKPREHHLRQWYVLADLYERAGDIPRARDTFVRIAAVDPEAFDTRQRVRALR